MVGKLLKYDLRASLKIFLFVWPALLLVALVTRFSILLAMGEEEFQPIFILPFILLIFCILGAIIFAYVINIVRFYSGLLRDEGYLMFTLPVKPWQLIVSKLITAFLTVGITTLLIIVSLFLLVDGLFRGASATFLWESMSVGVIGDLGILLLNGSVSLISGILMIYMSCAIGQLANKHRVLFSVLAYFCISMTISFVSSFFSLGALVGNVAIDLETLQWFSVGLNAVLSIVYFFVTERIFRTRLNLQ